MNLDPFSKNGLNTAPGKAKSSVDEVFVKSKNGGAGRRSAPAEALEPMDIPPAEVAPEPEKKKAAVVLRNPKWEVEKVGFNEEARVSVELELPPEHAHKTKVAFELFAKTPKGPERISQGDGKADGGKAIGTVPVYIPTYKDEDGNPLQKAEFYFKAKHSESEELDGSKAIKVVDEMAERLIKTHILPAVTFGFDKSFLAPNQTSALQEMCKSIEAWRKEHPEGKLALFGHADAVGKEEYNKGLSERRARLTLGFLMKDAQSWEDLYKEEKWGLAPIQDLLRHLGHDPGTSDGQDGPKTKAAVKSFQAQNGLVEDGSAGAETRKMLFTVFMDQSNNLDLKKKDFDDINGNPTAGCSEFNLMEKTEGACATNRRVAVLLLKSNKNFPIQYPCQKGSIGPCKKQVGRKGDRRTVGFGCGFYDKLVIEQKKEPLPVGALRFFNLPETEIKQYVNLPPGEQNHGFERLFEVEAENAEEGMQVFWKISCGTKNCSRPDPKPGLKLKGGKSVIEFKQGTAELISKFEAGKASMVLACGVAGGDTYIIEAGLSKDKMEVKATLCNWRKLNYEIMAPDFMPFEERVLPDGAKGMDFPSVMLARIRARLAKGFIEYEIFKSHPFTEAEAPKGSLFKSEQLGLPAGKKAYVLTDHTFKAYPKKFDRGMAPRSIGLKLCNANYYHVSGDSPMISRTLTFTSDTYIHEVAKLDFVYFLPISAENGGDAVKSFTWKALVDPKTYPNHPGVLNGRARHGILNSKDVNLITTEKFEIRLPKNNPMDPGTLVGASVTADRCPIEVRIKFEGAEGGLGMAGIGAQTGENLVVYNAEAPDCFVDVLLHELGHSMGQTVYDGIYLPPKGLPLPMEWSEADPVYGFNGSSGHVYVKKDHSGSHCAYGLSDEEKQLASFKYVSSGTCIMYGQNSGSSPSSATTGFCPQCEDYIKSRDLRDLSGLLE